jgi:hypothetical protein
MEKVVYLLGAGFSAPLGLPVMSNFRLKSEEMYAAEPEKYAYFQEVFSTIHRLSIAKNYYEIDLFNIEEILSVLEMVDYLEGNSLKQSFLQYIVDVVNHYTPSFQGAEQERLGGMVKTRSIFGPHQGWRPYGFFVANLFNVNLVRDARTFPRKHYAPLTCRPLDQPQAQYAIISLNYDMVLENICAHLADNLPSGAPLRLAQSYSATPSAPTLVKLHGSVDTGVIVPPTWSKGVNKNIAPAWKLAYQLLAEATHLRIIGYSLPDADTYVRYLLKAAVTEEPRLKKIDVICKDTDGSVQSRYAELCRFKFFDFIAADVMDYLKAHSDLYEDQHDLAEPGIPMDRLEEAHAQFVNSHR